MLRTRNILSMLTAAALLSPGAPLLAQEPGQPVVAPGRIRVTTELVLVNVVARDKKGNLIKDLKKRILLFTKTAKSRLSPASILRMLMNCRPLQAQRSPARSRKRQELCCTPVRKLLPRSMLAIAA